MKFAIMFILCAFVVCLKAINALPNAQRNFSKTELLQRQYSNPAFTRYSNRQRDDHKSRDTIRSHNMNISKPNRTRDDTLLHTDTKIECSCSDNQSCGPNNVCRDKN